jgi:hypothetical protein
VWTLATGFSSADSVDLSFGRGLDDEESALPFTSSCVLSCIALASFNPSKLLDVLDSPTNSHCSSDAWDRTS